LFQAEMNVTLLLGHVVLITILAVLPLTSCQDPVPIQFQSSPVLATTGGNAVFTVQTISNVFSITWFAPGGGTLGQWINGQAVINPLPQYQGRVSITATQLTISSSQLNDAGNYTVTVTPSATTGLSTNSRSVTLSVYVAVSGVSLFIPSVAIEGGNTSLTCSWTAGSGTSVTWGKGSSNLPSDPRFTINAGSLNINPVNRNDAGQYSCTVSNPVSSQTATASLTVYYGPDTPQVTKSSSNCVGGGDATIGQTVQLTCTAVSLPPALLSWQLNGVPLTASQANSGTLNLQIFSTNQSGQYTCLARNSITTQTSQQQTSLSIVGTCLSAGAVAGIVVACFVALVLIVVAIILILRQRRVDQRLRTVIGQQKENLNNRPTVVPAPYNGYDNHGFLGQGDQPDPPMHHIRLNHSKNQQTSGQHNNNNDILTANRTANTSATQPNNHLNADMFSNNATLNSSTNLHHNQRNSNSNRQTPGSFQQVGPQNPNILIQTGQSEPGPHTVFINLNPLPQEQNATTQPHTVQVSLNALPPSSGQPNQNTMPYNAQQSNTVHQELNTNQANLHHVRGTHSSPQTRTDNMRNTSQPAHSNTLRNGQRRDHQRRARQNTAESSPYLEQTRSTEYADHRLSVSVDDLDADTRLRQMPWDRMRGTPAYPNRQVDSYESQTSSESDSEHSIPALRPRRAHVDEQVWNVSRSSRRNLLRVLAHNAAQRRTWADRNVPRQVTQPNVVAQPHAENQRQTAPQIITPQRRTMDNTDVSVLPSQTVPTTIHPTHSSSQPGPDQRQTGPHNAAPPNTHVLTQAALQQHTNPFVNRIQQTQAALQHPETQAIPAQTNPTRQITQTGQAVPTPPPVLHPGEFKSLPRQHVQKPRTVKPVQVMRHPVVIHHGHRPSHMPRHARTMRNNLHIHPVNHHMPANAHLHGNPQGFAVTTSQ
ncbi:GATA zinc finger domain-containing protein 14-like, partial [Clarias magur]